MYFQLQYDVDESKAGYMKIWALHNPPAPKMNVIAQLQVLQHKIHLLASTVLSCLSGVVISSVS